MADTRPATVAGQEDGRQSEAIPFPCCHKCFTSKTLRNNISPLLWMGYFTLCLHVRNVSGDFGLLLGGYRRLLGAETAGPVWASFFI
jgi:hypothetical protein